MIELTALFTDGAVLQRRMWIPVWGKSVSRHLVGVKIGGNSAYARCGRDGSFLVRLPAMEAGGPYDLVITDCDSGETRTVSDVMVGEVWIAGGQSNMQYLLNSDWSVNAALPEEEKEKSVNRIQLREFLDSIQHPELIRGITVPMVASGCEEHDFDGKWMHLTRENAPWFCAVGNWFARFIQQDLGVAVGIICSNWGGTVAEAWTSMGGLMSNPDTIPLVTQHHLGMAKREPWETVQLSQEELVKQLAKPDPGNTGFDKGWAKPEFDDSSWRDFELPQCWTASGYSGNGAVWVRRKVSVPASWIGKELTLHLGPVDKQDVTYINGQKTGGMGEGLDSRYWCARRRYTVPGTLVTGTELTIAIRAYSFLWAGNFGGEKENYFLLNPETQERIPLAEKPWKFGVELDCGVLPVPGANTAPGPGTPNTAGILFDAMIRPLIPYGIRGVIWYQGESNANRLDQSRQYAGALSTMIRDWRHHWGQGDFPFIQVLLAKYENSGPRHSWAVLRESQQKCAAELPNVYSASAVDIGEAKDIHPQNKKDVGFRLAQSALYHVYHRSEVVPCGPQLTGVSVENGRIRLFFRYAEGLRFKGGKPAGFQLGSMDEVRKVPLFCDADTVAIEGSTLVVSSAACPAPAVVRYAWDNCPEGNLYNGAGLPAEPFRTDTENTF